MSIYTYTLQLQDFYKMRDTLIAEGYNYTNAFEIFSKVEIREIALEIIKEKEVNVYDFKEYESKYEYNKHTKEEFQELTQEEYDLLKKVLL